MLSCGKLFYDRWTDEGEWVAQYGYAERMDRTVEKKMYISEERNWVWDAKQNNIEKNKKTRKMAEARGEQ